MRLDHSHPPQSRIPRTNIFLWGAVIDPGLCGRTSTLEKSHWNSYIFYSEHQLFLYLLKITIFVVDDSGLSVTGSIC
jgi:hypothetical protein